MELYLAVAITDRDRSEQMSALYESVGLSPVFTKLGSGTATSEHLSLYDLEPTEKAIISAVSDGETAKQLLRQAKRKMFIDVPGNGILMTIPIKSVAGGRTLAYLSDSAKAGGRPEMTFAHELIVVILNAGLSDAVMDAARSAGAAGGTVLHAKGTGAVRARKFFGVSLAEEKDMVYIVAPSDEKASIMQAISEKTGPGTPAGAICFSLPISSVVGLRERDDG